MRVALAAALTLGLVAAANAEGQGLGHLYRPADGWAGEAIVRDIRTGSAPACALEDDLDAFSFAVGDRDEARILRMAEQGKCALLPNESYGEILGATPSGGGYLRLRMIYVHHFRELDGIEVFVPVTSLRDMSSQGVQPWEQYHRVLGD